MPEARGKRKATGTAGMSRRYELAIARLFPDSRRRIRCNARRMKNKPAQRRVTHLKEKAQRAYREYRAIYVLSNGLDDSGYEQMNLSLENIPNLSKAALRVFTPIYNGDSLLSKSG